MIITSPFSFGIIWLDDNIPLHICCFGCLDTTVSLMLSSSWTITISLTLDVIIWLGDNVDVTFGVDNNAPFG
jgi:hypothetical protein